MNKRITDSVYFVGALNPNLRVFDIIMAANYGTTYNAYVVKGHEKTALIETCHATYFDAFVENIGEVCDIAELDYIILNHLEPDHSGSLARLSELAPKAEIITSQAGSIYAKNITNKPDMKIRVVKQGDSVDLGGRTLQFINAPFLHWPDSMFTYLPEEKVLFPCDFLGAHYCEPYSFDTKMNYTANYEEAFLGYYNAIFGPFKPCVLAGLDKIKDLAIDFACTSHGPVLTRGCYLDYALEKYAQWSQPAARSNKLLPVFYTSAYGFTRRLANAIAQGMRDILPDAEIECYDIIHHDMAELHALLNACDGFAVGSPTINRDAVPPTYFLLAGADAINTAKRPVLVFGSYGWSGEAVPNIIGRVTGLKMQVYGEGYKVCFTPTEEDLARAGQLGADFAASISKQGIALAIQKEYTINEHLNMMSSGQGEIPDRR